MATTPAPAAAEQIVRLNNARNLALADPAMYSKVVPVILPILHAHHNPSQELRAWGADFLSETFSSPALSSEAKQSFSVQALPLLMEFLQLPPGQQVTPVEQTGMVKSAIQAAASVYPFIFRHIIRYPNEAPIWQLMSAIKSNILRRMDTELPGVRICCLRFVERVVQTQTPGVITDPRRPEQNEISLALVPLAHPVIPPSNLEAEAHGLLDRALGILQENHSDALLVTATLNGLGGLVRLRATVSNRIINAVLNYNPFRLASEPMTPASRLIIRSLEKTVVVLLANVLKRNPQHPMAARIDQHIIRLQQMRKDILDGNGLKRPAEEPVDGLDQAKRQRIGALVPGFPPPHGMAPPPFPPGPISYAQLYTLTDDKTATELNVAMIPDAIAARTLVHLLRFNIGKEQMELAADAVQARFTNLTSQLISSVPVDQSLDDDDEDYEPDYQPTEDAAMLKNRLEVDEPEDVKALVKQAEEAVGPFRLARPPPMSDEQIDMLALAILDRMFIALASFPETKDTNEKKRGFHEPVVRGAIDQSSYFRMIVRVAIRPQAGLESAESFRPAEGRLNGDSNITISDHVRQKLLQYILSDWQRRIPNAVTWFTEEWVSEQSVWKDYNESLSTSKAEGGDVKPPEPPRHYKKWVLRFIDDLSAYLGGAKSDMKVLVRLTSEIPALDADIVDRIASLADDPERFSNVCMTLQYLIVYRPPVKELCLDALQDIWNANRSPDGPAANLLKKYRPAFMEQAFEQNAPLKIES